MLSLKERLQYYEGLRTKAYQDHLGVWTIGYGRNLQVLQITKDQAREWLTEDITKAKSVAPALVSDYYSLSAIRQECLVEMVFQLGFDGVKGFKRFLAAIEKECWSEAHTEMLDSKWAKLDTPRRAQDVARRFLFGGSEHELD